MRLLLLLSMILLVSGCDHGLEPPEVAPVGAIRGEIMYLNPENWPPRDSVVDLRFFALPFVPRDTLDLFRDLSQLVFSEPLAYGVTHDSFFVDSIRAQVYVYSGVAQQTSRNLLDWRPVGLADLYQVRPGETMELSITVDFNNPPPFPPRIQARVTH